MEKGKIIFLNGTSSAGKTTLIKVLQERLEEPYFALDGERFHRSTGDAEMIPAKYRRGEPDVETAWKVYFDAMSVFHQTIKLFSDMGFNVIVHDTLEVEHKSLEVIEALREYPVLFVLVTCPAEELRRREAKRGDRQPGLAERLLERLYPKNHPYDVIADTFNNSTDECAGKIIKMLKCPEKWSAFKTLWSQRNK